MGIVILSDLDVLVRHGGVVGVVVLHDFCVPVYHRSVVVIVILSDVCVSVHHRSVVVILSLSDLRHFSAPRSVVEIVNMLDLRVLVQEDDGASCLGSAQELLRPWKFQTLESRFSLWPIQTVNFGHSPRVWVESDIEEWARSKSVG